MKKLQFVIVAALALALPGPGVAAASIQVTISATAFTPKTLTVNFGDTVKWKNADKVEPPARRRQRSVRVADPQARRLVHVHVQERRQVRLPRRTQAVAQGHGHRRRGRPPSVTLGVGLPIITYGQQTTSRAPSSNGQPNETMHGELAAVRLVRPAGRDADDRRRRELHVRHHAEHLHDVQREVEERRRARR